MMFLNASTFVTSWRLTYVPVCRKMDLYVFSGVNFMVCILPYVLCIAVNIKRYIRLRSPKVFDNDKHGEMDEILRLRQ